MAKDENPRLCGGTFFTLLLQDLKERKKAREHYKGERDGLSDPEVLIGLIKVINPDYEGPADPMMLKGKANDYKSCKTSKGEYLPFGDRLVLQAFDNRVKTAYPDALKDMVTFVNQFLEVGKKTKKEVWLVRAILDLISKDDNTDGHSFYIKENGQAVEKSKLNDMNEFCFPAFLLGIWHYAVMTQSNNKVGQPTYDTWCPPNGGAGRECQSDIGSGITRALRVYMPDRVEDASFDDRTEDVVFDFGDEDADTDDEERASSTTPPPRQQIIQNPLIIQQYGPNSSVMPNYGTMNITIGGSKKDE